MNRDFVRGEDISETKRRGSSMSHKKGLSRENQVIPIRFLNVREAAEYLKVSVSSIYSWKSQGRLKARKHGSRVVFDIHDLDNFDENIPDIQCVSKGFQKRHRLGRRSDRKKSGAKRSLKFKSNTGEGLPNKEADNGL